MIPDSYPWYFCLHFLGFDIPKLTTPAIDLTTATTSAHVVTKTQTWVPNQQEGTYSQRMSDSLNNSAQSGQFKL